MAFGTSAWHARRMRWVGLSLLAIAGCSGGVRQDSTVAPQLEASAPDLTGSYFCSFDATGDNSQRFACVIRKVNDKFIFSKLTGTQRIHGEVISDAKEGFTFVGEMVCEASECATKLHGHFKRIGHGELEGTFREDATVLRL